MRATTIFCLIGLGALTATAACGVQTETRVVDQGNGDPNADGSGDDPGATTDNGATGGKTDAGTGGSTAPKPPPDHLVTGLTVSDVAVFQAVKVPVVTNGAKATHDTPIVANRDALVRVYVKPDSSWGAKSATGQLRLVDTTGKVLTTLTDTKKISTASTDAQVQSTFNFLVDPTYLPMGVKFAVALTDANAAAVASGTRNAARYPQDGSDELLGTENSGTSIKIKIVPIQYMADGSGRLPDTSPQQIDRYKSVIKALYPVAAVDITVRAPYQYTSAINGNGNGFGTVLQRMVNLRQSDGAADDVYYWGAFAPTSSFSTYCNGSCVTGLSSVLDDPRDSFGRASVGVGFSGDESAYTAAHEIGHAHGRNHAPCGGASGVDSQFPYSTGSIGVWGYDLNAKALIDPSEASDMMGYCQPEWISDYTYSALFDRIQYVNHAKSMAGTMFPLPVTYRMVDVAADGTLTYGSTVQLSSQPFAEAHAVTYEAADGSPVGTATAHYYKYDHIPGGFMVVPETTTPYARIAVSAMGTQGTVRVSKQ